MDRIVCIFLICHSVLYTNTQECTSVTPADVIFVVDESSSVGHTHFTDTMNALGTTVDNLAIGENEIRVGFVLFHANATARSIADLNTSYDKDVLKGELNAADYANGHDTDFTSALTYTCQDMFVNSKGDRTSAQNYLVLLSDGKSGGSEDKHAGTLCKDDGVTIITVGIGESTSGFGFLKDLASTYPEHFLNTTYSELGTTLPNLVTSVVDCSSSGEYAKNIAKDSEIP